VSCHWHPPPSSSIRLSSPPLGLSVPVETVVDDMVVRQRGREGGERASEEPDGVLQKARRQERKVQGSQGNNVVGECCGRTLAMDT
jgi:hypothetical protein